MKVVYKITYPNEKIYVGRDLTNSINGFGSADSSLIARDFAYEQRQSGTITRDILWCSETASVRDVSLTELEFIRQLRSNESSLGYNRRPPASRLVAFD